MGMIFLLLGILLFGFALWLWHLIRTHIHSEAVTTSLFPEQEVKQYSISKFNPNKYWLRAKDFLLGSRGNPPAGMTARPVDRPVDIGITRGGYPPAAQPYPAPVPATEPASPAYIQTLIESYEAVRAGRIKDPHTIRSIAARFEALANDPNVTFDPIRAAQNLYNRAWNYEKEEKAHTSVITDVVTQPNTKAQGQAIEPEIDRVIKFSGEVTLPKWVYVNRNKSLKISVELMPGFEIASYLKEHLCD